MSPKLRMAAGGVFLALAAAGCAYDDPYYYSSTDPYYRSSYHYYPDRTYSLDWHHSGRVTGIDIVGAPVVTRPAEQYRVTVRHADGRVETYVTSSLAGIRVGDMVRIANGRMYPVG